MVTHDYILYDGENGRSEFLLLLKKKTNTFDSSKTVVLSLNEDLQEIAKTKGWIDFFSIDLDNSISLFLDLSKNDSLVIFDDFSPLVEENPYIKYYYEYSVWSDKKFNIFLSEKTKLSNITKSCINLDKELSYFNDINDSKIVGSSSSKKSIFKDGNFLNSTDDGGIEHYLACYSNNKKTSESQSNRPIEKKIFENILNECFNRGKISYSPDVKILEANAEVVVFRNNNYPYGTFDYICEFDVVKFAENKSAKYIQDVISISKHSIKSLKRLYKDDDNPLFIQETFREIHKEEQEIDKLKESLSFFAFFDSYFNENHIVVLGRLSE